MAALNAGRHGQSVPLVQRLSEEGCPQARLFLGLMSVEADGVPQDCSRGVALIRGLADAFYNDAQVFLGRLYEYGRCQERNLGEAYRWYAVAASHPIVSDTRAKARDLRLAKQVLLSDTEAKAGDAAALAWWRSRW